MSPEITSDPAFQPEVASPALPSAEPKKSADSILHVSRPGVTRYKRSMILASSAVVTAIVAAGIIIAFVPTEPKAESAKAETKGPPQPARIDFDDKLPKDYGEAAATTAGLAENAPGTAQLPPPGTDVVSSPAHGSTPNAASNYPPPPTPAQQRADELREQAIRQEMAARAGGIMFAGASPSAMTEASQSVPLGQTLAGDGSSLSGAATASARQDDQNMQGEKQQFIATAGIDSDYVKGALQAPRSRYEIKAGTVVPGALLTALNSDIPGEVLATVTANVYDYVTGRYILIPQGARLIGRYDSKVAYGQSRALVVWNRIIFPNGYSINIGSMTGTDASGASGVSDRVNNHLPGKIGGVALSTALAIGAAAADNAATQDDQLVTAGGGALSQEASRVGQEIIQRELNRQPTIIIRPGFPVRVLVNKDIILQPYPGARPRRP